MLKKLFKTLRVTTLCGAAVLGCMGNAHAAYVVINADPAFGLALPNLGWRAIGAIYVPDACLSDLPSNTNANVLLPTSSGPCSGILMKDVKVGLYNLANPGTLVEVLNIGNYEPDLAPPPGSANDLAQDLLSIDFDANHNVVGFKTTLSSVKQAFNPIALYQGNATYFALEFSSGLDARLVAFNSAEPAGYASRAAESVNPPSSFRISAYSSDLNYVAPTFDDAVNVPEPGSLALVGLALAGLGLASRRRSLA